MLVVADMKPAPLVVPDTKLAELAAPDTTPEGPWAADRLASVEPKVELPEPPGIRSLAAVVAAPLEVAAEERAVPRTNSYIRPVPAPSAEAAQQEGQFERVAARLVLAAGRSDSGRAW